MGFKAENRGFSRLAKTGVGSGPNAQWAHAMGRKQGIGQRKTVFPLSAENIMNGLTGGAA